LSRFFTWLYEPVLRVALRWKWRRSSQNFAIVPLTIPLVFALGSEFMPPLYEGSMLYMPTSPPGMSITEATGCCRCKTSCSGVCRRCQQVFGTVAEGPRQPTTRPWGW